MDVAGIAEGDDHRDRDGRRRVWVAQGTQMHATGPTVGQMQSVILPWSPL